MDKPNEVLDTVNFLPDQLWEAWEESRKVELPDNYKNFKRVLVCGMGGSALGGRVIQSFSAKSAKASIEVSTNYNLPAYVDNETLVIISSYSGNTEETLSCFTEAIDKKVPIFVISSGGKLEEMAREHSLPIYKIDPHFNPSGQPRLAVGYSIGAIFGVLGNTGVLSETDDEIKKVVDFIKGKQKELQSKGEEIAKVIQGKMPILVASEHLVGAAYVGKNQLNESAKSFSALFELPELNHHLMEGLKNPKECTNKLLFIFYSSKLYHERIQIRYPLTKEDVSSEFFNTEYNPKSPLSAPDTAVKV